MVEVSLVDFGKVRALPRFRGKNCSFQLQNLYSYCVEQFRGSITKVFLLSHTEKFEYLSLPGSLSSQFIFGLCITHNASQPCQSKLSADSTLHANILPNSVIIFFIMASSSTSPLTFGIEIEGIFAFHQEKLVEHIQTHLPSASIIKPLNPDQRKSFRQKAYPDQLYQSWALANADESSMTAEASLSHQAGRLRAYQDEPLHIAKVLLSSTECGKRMLLHNPANHSKPDEYKSWILTSDHSLVGLANHEKTPAFPRKIPSSEVDNWDTYGIELVSPPYLSTNLRTAQEDISSLFSAIHSPSSSITTNQTCGLHVHIGTPNGEALPLKVLQHLSFLLVIYEHEIARLHPGHRRQRPDEIESNRLNFFAEYPAPNDTILRTVIDEETDESSTKKFESTFKAVSEIRRIIFDEVENAVDPVAHLLSRLGRERGYIVNYKYLNRRDGPQTIEFRQHAGSVDAEEIAHWVRFCLALVKLAIKYAEEGKDCGIKHWNDKIDVEDLMVEMELEAEEREYYKSKAQEYDCPDAPELMEMWVEAFEDEFEEDGDSV
jgi:hypothetical protein